jgi:hypothetical protein
MQQIITTENLRSIEHNVQATVTHDNAILTRFMAWCEYQEEKRFIWLAIGVMGRMGMVLPVTVVAMLLSPLYSTALLIFALAVNVPVLALNLAAQHTKITLPVMFTVWTVDAIIIALCALSFFAW